MDGPPNKSLIAIDAPPKPDAFTPLAEFQERTPASFFDGKPVLHYHAVAARAQVPASQRRRLPVFRAAGPATTNAPAAEGGEGGEEELVEQTVDVYVNSENFTLFSQDAACGVQIPYPLIGIHAVKTLPASSSSSSAAAAASDAPVQAVYMQLDLQDGGADDETYDTVELTIIPAPAPTTAAGNNDDGADATAAAPTTTTTAATTRGAPKSQAALLFDAISACAELHPDAADDDDNDDDDGAYEIDDRVVFESADGFDPAAGVFRGASDGGLPPPLPGSSGWITADNVADYFDADGNWIGGGGGVGGELGEGAGRVRGRDEAEAGDGGAPAAETNGQGVVNGQAGEDDQENKRQRTG